MSCALMPTSYGNAGAAESLTEGRSAESGGPQLPAPFEERRRHDLPADRDVEESIDRAERPQGPFLPIRTSGKGHRPDLLLGAGRRSPQDVDPGIVGGPSHGTARLAYGSAGGAADIADADGVVMPPPSDPSAVV